MKKDIMVIRESIGRIVSMLTLQSIRVTQRGSRAFVSYHPTTGAIKELNVPYIPDDASDEFIAAIQGFLDHEVGHVLYSDFKALKDANKFGKRIANMANIVEDVFVERKMTEGFRGSSMNLESVRKFYLEKIARPKIEDALRRGNTQEATGYATVAAFRAWGGQIAAQDFIKDPTIAALVKPIADKLGPELMASLGTCKNSMECLNLAKVLVGKLEEPKPKEEEPAPPKSAPKPKEEESDTEPGDEKEDTEPGEGGDVKESVEADDSGKTGSDDSDPVDDDGTDETGDSAGDKSAERDREPGEEDKTEEGDSGEPEASDDAGDLPGGDKSAPGDEDDEESDKDTEGEGAASGDKGEPADDGKSSSSDGDDNPDADLPEAPPEPDPLGELMDKEHDFDKDIGDHLSKESKKIMDDAAYSVFSTEWDQIIPAPLARSETAVTKLDASVKDKVAVMQKQLERGIAAQAKKCWNPGRRTGRIAPGSLFKTSVGDDRVFRQRFETKAKNTAVSLVVDCSGSMSGSRIHLAGVASYALATVLERLRLKYEVIGFTTTDSYEMRELMEQDAKFHKSDIRAMGWNRMEALYMPVFKPFSGKLDMGARSRIAHLTEGRVGWLSQNVDGECVQIAARRLVQQTAERHIMIVLSDGEPAAMISRGLNAHLKKTVKDLTKQGVEVIGIGIQTNAVASFYPKSVVLNNLDELPARVVAELTKLLLAA